MRTGEPDVPVATTGGYVLPPGDDRTAVSRAREVSLTGAQDSLRNAAWP